MCKHFSKKKTPGRDGEKLMCQLHCEGGKKDRNSLSLSLPQSPRTKFVQVVKIGIYEKEI
jgi:hypothetical protein